MKAAFEKVAQTYETVKKSVQEKWEGFKKKFEGTKTEASQEVMNAETPDDLIALGKKLQAQGEALKAEEGEIKQEESTGEALEAEKGEMFEDAHEEALVENEKFDENKAAEQAEAERVAAEDKAAHEQYVQEQSEAEETRLAEIRAKLNGEETIAIENAELVAEKDDKQQALIERIGAPQSEMFEKYGSRMREAADELVLASKEWKIANNKLRSLEKDYADADNDDAKKAEISKVYDEVKKEVDTARDKFNQLRRDASFGAEVIPKSGQKMGETYMEADRRRDAELKKYNEAAMNDPYVVLRMIEAGAIGGDASGTGLRGVAERLMSDTEFVSEAIKLASKDSQGSYDGWFWRNVSGEARANKELFIEAVKLNHLNYQFGSQEMKSDPEIQKVALKSGLSPTYLYKG
jgi:hypothetical protein